MVDFASAESEQEFIESIRDIYRAYVPESDAWAQPNFFSVNATVVGGLAWSAVNEARRGFDMRVNPQTAVGEYLDLIAGTPPLALVRRPATVATGEIIVSGWPDATIPAGTMFETAAGVKFTTTETVNVGGAFTIAEVVSVLAGSANNSLQNQPMTSGNVSAISLGIFGGFDAETDDQFRARIYAEQTKYAFFGSACSYERMMLAVPGVSRAWAIEDGGVAKIVFLMEDKYPCGTPLAEDIEEIKAFFDDPCLTPLFFCPDFQPACSRSIDLVIEWTEAPDDICAIEAAFEEWLRVNYSIGEGVRGCDIDAWLKDSYPEYGPVIECCEDFPAISCCVYNCANLTPSCENEETETFTLNNWTSAAVTVPGECFEGDLAAINPGLPPGAFFLVELTDFEPFGINAPLVEVNPDGTFRVCNTEGEDGDTLTGWTFTFEYRAGDVTGVGQAVNSNDGPLELFPWSGLGAPLDIGQIFEGNLRDFNPDIPPTPGFSLVPGSIWSEPGIEEYTVEVIVNPNGTFTVENTSQDGGGTITYWEFRFVYTSGGVDTNEAMATGQGLQAWFSSGSIAPGATFEGNLRDIQPEGLPAGVFEFNDISGYDFSTGDGQGPGELTLNPDGSFIVENIGENIIWDWHFTWQYVSDGGATRSPVIDATHTTPN